jgi:hypothetical protein
VNVPGVLLGAAPGGARIYTLETAWDAAGSPSTSLHALDLTERGTARLAASVTVAGWISGAVREGGFAWAVAQGLGTTGGSGTSGGTAGGVATSPAWGTGADLRLVAVDLESMRLAGEQVVEASWCWPLAAAGDRLFLSAGGRSGPAVLVLGLADPAHPALERTVPTQGQAWEVVVEGDTAYLPSGAWGVPTIPLGPARQAIW